MNMQTFNIKLYSKLCWRDCLSLGILKRHILMSIVHTNDEILRKPVNTAIHLLSFYDIIFVFFTFFEWEFHLFKNPQH